jgi:hypothetical protein
MLNWMMSIDEVLPDEPPQQVPGPDPERPDEPGEPYVIEPRLPTDEDGDPIYPADAPREGDGPASEATATPT